MGKGSGRRPAGLVTDKKLQDNWDRIFGQKPNDKQFEGIKDGNKPNAEDTKKIKG
tara:strand:+ start:175 stop:339 length:165 start_codon:yes stop_codon:yes gene_type:complete